MERETPFHPLKTPEQLEQARARSHQEPVVLYKHSITCPISTAAQQQMRQLTRAEDPPVYALVVQESRRLSDEIASSLDIRHETPQAIVLYRDRPIFHASHRRVTADGVREAAAGVHADT